MSSSSSNSGEITDKEIKRLRYRCTGYDVSKEPMFVEDGMHFLAYQREVCPSTNRQHWQIYVELKKKLRYPQVDKLLGMHVSCYSCDASPEANLAYVTKEESFDKDNPIRKQFGTLSEGRGKKRNLKEVIDEVKEYGVKKALNTYPEDVLRHMTALLKIEAMYYKKVIYIEPLETLRSFQRMILDLAKEEAGRRPVYWFCDKKGGCGKSILVEQMAGLHGAFVSNGGKRDDIIHAATEFVKLREECKIVLFDFVRTTGDAVSFAAIENIKNGYWTSNKYMGGTTSIKPPHVICFANDWPDVDRLSHDRWKLYAIEKEGEDYIASEKTVDWVKTMKGPRDGYGAPA